MTEENIISSIKVNSGLSESTETVDVTNTEQIIGSIIEEKYNNSLAYQICDVQPVNGSFGKTFAIKKKADTPDIEVVSKDIETKIYSIKTGFTQEVYQDMMKVFNKDAKAQANQVFTGLSHQEENRSVIDLIHAESETMPAVTITDSASLESVIIQLSKKVSESVIEMNRGSYKTLDSFCILSKDWAAAILGSFDYMTEGREKSLFVGRVGRTDYYINPFPNTASQFTDDFDIAYEIEDTSIPNYCYVGLKSNVPGTSSLVFAPYLYETQYVTDPDTLEINLFLRNRYGLVTSPLHEPLRNRSLLHKFELVAGEYTMAETKYSGTLYVHDNIVAEPVVDSTFRVIEAFSNVSGVNGLILDTATNNITIQESGTYNVGLNINYTTGNNKDFEIYIFVNNLQTIMGVLDDNTGGVVLSPVSVDLQAGDVIDMRQRSLTSAGITITDAFLTVTN